MANQVTPTRSGMAILNLADVEPVVSTEGALDVDKARAAFSKHWNKLAYEVPSFPHTEDARTEYFWMLLFDLAVNSTSKGREGNTTITLYNTPGTISSRYALKDLGDIRRWARAFSDDFVAFLQGNPSFRAALARAKGVAEEHGAYAFDFLDEKTQLPSVAAMAQRWRAAALSGGGAEPEPLVDVPVATGPTIVMSNEAPPAGFQRIIGGGNRNA